MKYLVYFFVLANIVLFLWRQSVPETLDVAAPPTQHGAEKLRLLAELPASPASDSRGQSGQNAASTADSTREDPVSQQAKAGLPASRCFTLGPFDELTVNAMQNRLQALADKVQQRQVTEQEQYGYQVFIPALASLARARRVAGQLREKGLSDYFIMTGDTNRNAISLGLFREKRYASRHLDHVNKLGFEAVMEPRYRERVRFWINYRDDEGAVNDNILREISGDKPVQRLEHDCRGLL